MLLALDIGNTNIVLGLLKTQPSEDPSIGHCWRLGTSQNQTDDEYGSLIYSLFQQHQIPLDQVTGVIICCVVPNLLSTFVQLAQRMFSQKALVVGPGTKTGMPILYDNPKEVGADRIVNAVAAYKRFQKACIITDFGTATTFDFVTPEGQYAGGVIGPGIAISADALFQKASKLPRVDIVAPERVVGRNTVDSIQSGLYYGSLGMVDRIVEEILAEFKLAREEVAIVATGGLAPLLVQGSQTIEKIIPHLTLEGLEIIHQLNRG